MKGDPNESAVVLVLQFVGMLFYSMTIQNVSSIVMGNDDQVTSPMFALFRVEDVENLIVKVERQLPPERKIPGKVIQQWKDYTFNYFNSSPNAFLADNAFYQHLSSNMKVKVVKKNLLHDFQEKFEILFIDFDFGFRADDKLISQVIASLSYEHFFEGELIIGLDEISPSIYLIQDGQVEVSHKDSKYVLLQYDEGSYIGDTSFIFRILNQYSFKPKQSSNNGLFIYSLKEKYLTEIFHDFPKFENLLKIRALRRHHYLRKIKK